MAIQDTRDQDTRIEPAQLKGVRNRKRALQIAAAIAVLAAAVWLTLHGYRADALSAKTECASQP